MSEESISSKDISMYSLCIREAEKSTLFYQHGCIATHGGKIIARGCNTSKCSSQSDYFLQETCSCHAEINVLRQIYYNKRRRYNERKLKNYFKKTTLYISRSNRIRGTKLLYNSAPCEDCLSQIQMFSIKRIVYCMNNNIYSVNPDNMSTTHKTFGKNMLEEKGVSNGKKKFHKLDK